eukprot:5315153-Pyramimonas_sp.AAC.1
MSRDTSAECRDLESRAAGRQALQFWTLCSRRAERHTARVHSCAPCGTPRGASSFAASALRTWPAGGPCQ